MKLYLDIDGVLLHTKEDKAAEHAAELIEYITSEFDCYWLTTHCKGDSGPAVQYLSEYFPDRIVKKLFKFEAQKCRCNNPICTCPPPRIELITKKPITASEEELKINPPSRSAKLRIFERK